MAKLEKGLQDYFKIPVLLRPVGSTPIQSVQRIHKILSTNFQSLLIDDRYEPMKTAHSQFLQKRDKNSLSQTFLFRLHDYVNQWSQFQVIYRCRFCIGIFNCQGNIGEEWKKAVKSCADENKKMVGLIILSLSNCDASGIKQPSIIIPEKLQEQEYVEFLEPWFYSILSVMEDHICFIICELQKQDNSFIVFNKMEEKPEPRTLKKKKRGRCLKVCGDFCMILNMIKHAYAFFVEAQEILRKVDDYLWVLGCNQGKLACFTTDVELPGVNKQSALQTTRLECINLGRKIKIPHLEIQNYFKILKVYTKINPLFEQMARQFCNYVMTNYSSSQKFSIITQLAMLYREAGMIRKQNYMLYLATRIAIDLKPTFVSVLLTQIMKSEQVKQWPLLNANVIKLLIDNTNDSKDGLLHLNLIENCSSVMTQRDVSVTLQALERRNFKAVHLQKLSIFQICAINCKQSEVKPKPNSLQRQSPSKGSTTFFMNWRKKESIYKYQKNQQIIFEIKIVNKLPFPIRCSLRLHFSQPSQKHFQSFELHPKMNKIHLKDIFHQTFDLVTLQSIQLRFFNFYFLKLVSPMDTIKMEIYEEYPKLTIQTNEVFQNQESSLFCFPFKIKRTKKHLKLEHVELTVSIYYHIDVGYQQAIFKVDNIDHQHYLLVLQDYPYSQGSEPNIKILRLPALRANKKHLKKIQCKVDAIAFANSKYQISAFSSTSCVFQRSIWCELVSLTSSIQAKFNRKDERIIMDDFMIKIAVHKKEHDLTPYKIVESNNSYILSEKTAIFIEKTLRKLVIQQYHEQPLVVQIQWSNSTREKQCGIIDFQIPISPVMIISRKQVNFKIDQWNGKCKQQLVSPAKLSLNYTIRSAQQNENLNHEFIVQPLHLPNIRKYITVGKVRIKRNQKQMHQMLDNEIKNSVHVKMFYEYAEEYMFGIRFEDEQIYWFPCIFNLKL